MIAVRIPKEIREYKEKILIGLTLRQMFASVLALGICVPLYLYGKRYINEEIIAWLVMIIALPLAGIGFVKINGMPFEKAIVSIFKSEFLYPKKRVYRSNNCFKKWEKAADEEYISQLSNKQKKQLKKFKIESSFERIFLMLEAEEKGIELTKDDLSDDNILTVRTKKPNISGGGNPKKPKKDEDEKVNEIKSSLQLKAEEIKNKQTADPHYVPSDKERKILLKYAEREQKIRRAEIIKGTAATQKTNFKMEKRRTVKTAIPKTTQQSIPFIADYEEGLFEVEPGKYSKTYKIKDINYSTSKEEEQVNIFCKWGEFLNSFSEDYNMAVTVNNRVISKEQQEESFLYPIRNDEYDIHRTEYNKIIRKQISAGRNDIQQQKYITITIEAETPYEALIHFRKTDIEVLKNLKRIGSKGKVLTTDERLALMHDIYRQGRAGELKVDYDFIKEQGISSKDYIAPSSFEFMKNYFKIEDQFCRCMYLNNLPSSLADDFFSEFVEADFPMITTLAIKPIAEDKALRLVKKSLTGMEANKIEQEKKAVRAGYSPDQISHELSYSLQQANELLDDVQNKNQKLFYVTIGVMVCGKTMEELEYNCKSLIGKAKKKTCQLQRFDWQQEEAYKVIVPMGYTPDGKVFVERTLTTESTSIFMPFESQELLQPGGFYYGLNQISHNLIMCNRKLMKTPSGFVLGSSGSGKSFAIKREILNVLLNDSETSIIVIDPENEYGTFAKAFGGSVIKISSDTNNFINPMDMGKDYGLDEDDESELIDIDTKKTKALKKKSEYIISIIEKMISTESSKDTSTITPIQKTIVDRCVQRCYQEYLDNDFNKKYQPTLHDLQIEFDNESAASEEGRTIAEAVEYYTRGTMDIFSHATNINFDNRLVVFNVRDLGDQLRQIALIIIFDYIWNRMIENKNNNVRTYLYCDEIHVMFESYYSAYFLKQLFKRGRKYGLVITGITQNVEDLLSSNMARGMIGNSDFILMLSQAPEDLKILSKMLNISDSQMDFVSFADAGSGLLFAENTLVPFVDRFPEDSYLYKLMSTNFDEKTSSEEILNYVQELINEQKVSQQ